MLCPSNQIRDRGRKPLPICGNIRQYFFKRQSSASERLSSEHDNASKRPCYENKYEEVFGDLDYHALRELDLNKRPLGYPKNRRRGL